MNGTVYDKLADLLDTLPNGFPRTGDGVEIELLKKIFSPEQAELFCDLRLTFELASDVAKRTGRSLEGLDEKLREMADNGQLFMITLGADRFYRILPWVFGIYEFQVSRMDRELASLCDRYYPAFGKQHFSHMPQAMQTLAIEETIPSVQEALPYEKVSTIIEGGQSFLANECICKKEKGLLDSSCRKPTEVCLAVAPVPDAFESYPHSGRIISKAEAYELLKKCEEAGLVHLASNVQLGHLYICNCCSCCCGVLGAINRLGIPASQVVSSHYCAEIDPGACTGCGLCADERCQVGAIREEGDVYRIVPESCIGCGLCTTTCPTGAIRLARKAAAGLQPVPEHELEWLRQRAEARGMGDGYTKYL